MDLLVEDLSICFGARTVVQGLSLRLRAGKTVALVGESGSGKSVTARTLVGLTGDGATVTARRIEFGRHNLLQLSERAWRNVRGKQIGFVLQDALVSLDPLRTVGKEIRESLTAHGWGDRRSRQERVIQLLRSAGVPDPELRAQQRPDELSGGLRQRALIASALAMNPALLIADEPTTALDVTVQAQIIALLNDIKASGRSMLLISHDLAVVAQLADEVLVLRHGEVVEQGSTAGILQSPQHPYTKSLLDSLPAEHPRGTRLTPDKRHSTARRVPAPASRVLLEARNLTKHYRGPDHIWRPALEEVNFTLYAGRTLGIVGESGSGKTTAARIAVGLLQPTSGAVSYLGRPWNGGGVSERERRPLRREVGIIYQDPLSSFDPRWSVGRILGDALDDAWSATERHERTIELLEQVRLPPELIQQHPLRLSGGQRQRIAIARAVATRPKLIICDEPVSSLDVSVQAQVLDLLADLQDELGLAYLFISHDLGVVRHISDDALVMYRGRVVESGPTERLFQAPQHPYTQALLAAVPRAFQPTMDQHDSLQHRRDPSGVDRHPFERGAATRAGVAVAAGVRPGRG